MRVVILAAAASLAFAGAAMARESVYHHHHHAMHHYNNAAAAAPVAEGAAPADNLGNHEQYMRNLHDSGYNPHGDLDAYGNMRQN
jgi:hypothetical protein